METRTLAPAGARRRRVPRDAMLGYALLAPGLALVVGLVGYPFVNSVWLSFHRKLMGVPAAPFIGLGNYASLFANPDYWTAVQNVFVYTVGAVALKLVIGMAVAVIINERLPLRGLVRSLVLLPWAIPALVTVLAWRWMYNDLFGVFNYILMQLGLVREPVLWLGSRNLAMASVVAVNVWIGFPFFAITLLAAMQGTPEELYDAAKVEGAGPAGRFRHVTLPGALPVIAIVTLLSTIWTFNDFTVIWMLTGGGPGHATEVLSTLTYKIAIAGSELGKGVAVSVTLMPLLLVLIVLLTRFTARREAEV